MMICRAVVAGGKTMAIIEWIQVPCVIWKILRKLYGLSYENGYWRIKIDKESYNKFNPLAPELFFLISAHSVYKM
jgi:hypothetical protein